MILENLVFKTHGEARRYCEKYEIEVKGNTDVFMIARGLARAFLEGEKVMGVDFPILRIIDKYLQAGGHIEKRHERICLVDKNGEYLAGGNNLKELLENCVWTFC